MQKTHYFCDICKQEFKPSVMKTVHLFNRNMDFCEECNKELINLVTKLSDQKTGGKE